MTNTDRENKLKAARLFVMTESAQTVAEHIVNLSEAWQDCQKRMAEYEQAAREAAGKD
jgi:hypothetical protein